ncbi:MAG: family 10 glycosylhydrolase, partial [Gemmatimonadaceae bacterium]
PGNAWSWDPASRAGFGKNPDAFPAEWKAYRTGLVNMMVKEAHDSIIAVKPGVVYSAAVWGIYFDKWPWKTLAGATDLMQDYRAWAREGYMDILVPMTYSRIKEPCARIDWGCMLDEQMKGSERETGRHMYIGIDASKGPREVVSQIRLARERGATGMAVFSYSALANAGGFRLLGSTVFSERAEVPAMPWKTRATH